MPSWCATRDDSLQLMKQPDEFRIPAVEFPDESQFIENTLRIQQAMVAESKGGGEVRHPVPENVVKGMADIATHVWKARSRMIDPTSGEVREEMKRVHGDIQRIDRCLADLGVVIEDQTAKPFDYGLPWKVVATKPVPGLTKEIVTETLRPTIRWNQTIIQHAEVEIGTAPEKPQNL